MYTPDSFAVEDRETLLDIVASHPLALLVTNGAQGPIATQLPLLLEPQESGADRITGHFARANTHWQSADGQTALAVFRGVDGYVTPDWYATKRATGKVVPTWNYVSVQARGRLDIVDNPDEARAIIEKMTNRMEAPRKTPWAVGDAPGRYIDAMMRGLVTFEMTVETLYGQAKLSQNKDEADQSGVRAGLASDPAGQAMLDAMDRWA